MAQTVLANRQVPSSSGASLTEIEIDFGTTPQVTKVFTITDALVSGTNKILATASGNVATGRVGNDAEWDAIIYTAKAGTGNFELTANCITGAVVGKRKVFYQVS